MAKDNKENRKKTTASTTKAATGQTRRCSKNSAPESRQPPPPKKRIVTSSQPRRSPSASSTSGENDNDSIRSAIRRLSSHPDSGEYRWHIHTFVFHVPARDEGMMQSARNKREWLSSNTLASIYKQPEDEESEKCCVCLEELKAKDRVRRLWCQHVFHRNCIDDWVFEHLTCPVCRTNCEL